MPQIEIKALRRITDGGHNIAAGQIVKVDAPYAHEWVKRGWASIPAAPRKNAGK